jgi:hypothetical protein
VLTAAGAVVTGRAERKAAAPQTPRKEAR